jgi:hypothetical protein
MKARVTELPAFLLEKLDSCPTAGSGVNRWLFTVSRQLHAHFSEQTIFELLRDKTHHCGRSVKDSEIIRQIKCSRAAAWAPDHPEAFAHAGDIDQPIIVRPPIPTWPEAGLDAIRAIVADGWGLYDLWERSPVGLDGERNHSEEIIDSLFPGNPLLCCGKTKYDFANRRRDIWRGHLERLAFIVPNPMFKFRGLTQDSKESEHCLEATARRIYLCIEFDFSEYGRDGVTETQWAPLVREWRAATVTVADACAALHLHLAQRVGLVLAVSSGGKSLHGWYAVYNQTEKQLRPFMEYAVSLGADRQLWCRSQFSRMPDGRRENGNPQITCYFDPGKAVRA